MGHDWTNANRIQIMKKSYLETVEVVDGPEIASGRITHELLDQLRIDNYLGKLKYQLTKLSIYRIIL